MANLLDNKYQLQELISQSERNLVYKAFEPARNRPVAIKFLSPALSGDQTAVQQFRQEMQLIASLNHRNILSVYDYGLQEDRLYLVTPYVPGATLQERIDQFYPLERASRIIQSLTDALAYAHNQGIIHGNLKPSNILIDEEGQPLLTDFGAFQKIGEYGLGSPYQSPEQAQGGPIDARTDVYALGVLLYEMLLGQPPPKGASLSPHLQRPDLPLEVEQVILTAMAEDPAERFQSVRELNQALEAAIPAEAAAPPAATGTSFWQTIPWWGYALVGVVVLFIIGVLAFSVLFGGRGSGSGGSTIIIGGEIIVVPTPVPGGPSLAATANVNIRSGPGLDYDIIGVLKQDQTADVIGVSPDSQWWTIRLEAAEGGQGWVSAQFTATENTGNVPIIQPPPLPQPTATPPVAFTGWRGEYFDNRNLRGEPVLVRDDAAINFDWGEGSPAPEVPVDNFSARWTINREMPAGTYRFSIWVDDGARLFVDDGLVIDAWQSGSPRNYVADVNLAQGPHTLRLEYFEADGGALISLGIGYIAEDVPPRAVINGTTLAQVGQTVGFNARNSTVAGGSHLAEFEWEFGDGATASGVDVTHVYDSPGRYTVSLTVTDDKGLSGSDTLEIQIEAGPETPEPGEPPLAVIDAPAEVEVGQRFTLDAGGSEAANPIVSYAWDLGDGNSANAVTIEHAYNSPGVYNVSLTITDDQGAEGRTNTQISVLDLPMPTIEPEEPTPTLEPEEPTATPAPEETAEPEPPTAAMTASAPGQIFVPEGQTITVPISQTITFDAGGSQPGSSAIVSYAWTFDGVASPTTDPVITQTFRAAGSYQLNLTVTDENNLSNTLTWQVQVTE